MQRIFLSYLNISILTAIALCIVHISVFTAFDPLQLRKAASGSAKYTGNQRLEAAGIIRYEAFDSLIVGTSTSKRYPPDLAEKLWGEKFLNLSEDGVTFHERALLAGHALRTRSLKRLVLSMDFPGALGEGNPLFPLESYDYLYNDAQWDDLKAYVGYAHLDLLLCRLDSNCQKLRTIDSLHKDTKPRLTGVGNWLSDRPNNYRLQRAKSVVRSLQEATRQNAALASNSQHDSKLWQERKALFDAYVLDLAVEQPKVIFHLVFPPHSRLYYASKAQSGGPEYWLHQRSIQYLVEQADRLKNLEVHGFETADFLDDSENYYDTLHFSPHFAKVVVRGLHSGSSKLMLDNVEAYLQESLNRALSYDTKEDIAQLTASIQSLEKTVGIDGHSD